ncbi:MAG: M20/M25/M40 family metallo-hydrolase [Oscillospiraceae bacterium]|nr:M20/M25/M40 family metallo-hydrolase [Oscillospiraceae bacterium]
MIGWIILALLIVLVAVVLLRAAAFKPKDEKRAETVPVEYSEEHAIETLRQMVMCKTVSYYDPEKVDEGELEKFRQLLKDRFPKLNETCELKRFDRTGVLYRWKGKNEGDPTVLMSHYDVVPVEEEQWDKPPFAGIIEDGVLWGRGTLDNKNTLCGIMEAAENLISQGFVPDKDIYFAFAGDEEINGTGADAIVSYFKECGIRPALVLDEGGAVVEGVFPGFAGKMAAVGVAEKGLMDVEFITKSKGGHASAPPPHGPVGYLAQTVVNVEKHPFRFQLTKPIAEMFDTIGRRSSFAMKLVFANLWLFKPVLNMLTKKSGGELNAMMRTTVAFTTMDGSKASNVIPPQAKVGANMRLMGTDTPESAVAYLKQIVNNPDIEIVPLRASNPSPNSSTDSDGWKRVKNAVEQTWTDAVVTPYLMIQCSDSRHYNRITDNIYKFSCAEMSKEERGSIHGNNEKIPVDKIGLTVAFYMRLMQLC